MTNEEIEKLMREETDSIASEVKDPEDAKKAEETEGAADAKGKKEDKKHKSRIAALEKETESLKKQLEEANDKYLRIMAEYDNFRKRSKAEKDAVYSDAVSDSVKELLPLFDNLERASAYTDGDSVAKGLEMILKTIPDVLTKLNVEVFGEKGDTFDPNIHNAIMHEENDEFGESEIVEVFQRGYRIGDKIVRYSMVKVAN